MSRWLVLTAFGLFAPMLGCGYSLRPGLANGPRLGGTGVADERVHDVVANGDEACGLYAENGTPRNRIPPCPSAQHSAAAVGWWPKTEQPANEGLVVPWLKHFYVGWPCARSPIFSQETHVFALDAPGSAAATCGAGEPR